MRLDADIIAEAVICFEDCRNQNQWTILKFNMQD